MDNAGVTQFHHVGLSIASDPYIGPMSLLAKTIKQHGAVPGLQIVHPGRDAAFVRGDDLISSSVLCGSLGMKTGAEFLANCLSRKSISM